MRHVVVITLLGLVVLLVGCDEAPAEPPIKVPPALLPAEEAQLFQVPLPNGGTYIEAVWPSGKPPYQPSAGRGKYTGRCFPVKDDNNLVTLGGSIAPSTTGVGGPADNRTVYRGWVFIGDPQDAEHYRGPGPYPNSYLDEYGRTFFSYIDVFVPQTTTDFLQMEREGRRICVGDLIKPGPDSVTRRSTGFYWGTLR